MIKLLINITSAIQTYRHRKHEGKTCLKSQSFLLGFSPECQPWCYNCSNTESHSWASALQPCTWQLTSKSQPSFGTEWPKRRNSKHTLHSDFMQNMQNCSHELGLWFPLAHPCQHAMKANLFSFGLFPALQLPQRMPGTQSRTAHIPPVAAEQYKQKRCRNSQLYNNQHYIS